MPANKDNKRIAKNTLLLYIRMMVLMIVSLYTSRVTLQVLGVEDFGTYNAVGGIVAMFSVLTGALANAISRYLQVELGKGNTTRLNTVFCTSVNVQIILSLMVAVIGEAIGLWFLYNKMVIPDGREIAAQWVLHASVLTFIIGLISIPYNAAIIAHEKMSAFAYITIVEAVLKLLVSFSLIISPFDKLITFAVLLCSVQLLLRFIYARYCNKHFQECSYHILFDRSLLKEMFGFAGWNLLTNGAFVLNNQGINLLMNVFFGVVVNAARGVASQVNNAVMQLISNFTTALTPAIVKNYAAGQKDYAITLACKGAKYSYLLLFFVSLPILIETPIILELWLKNPPESSVSFLRWTLISSLTTVFGNTLFNLVMADGKVKEFQMVMAVLTLMPFPLAWILFHFGCSPVSGYIAYFAVYFSAIFVRFYLTNRVVELSAKQYLVDVILCVAIVSCVASILPVTVVYFLPESISRLFITIVVCVFWTSLCIYVLGLDKTERLFVARKAKTIIAKVLK